MNKRFDVSSMVIRFLSEGNAKTDSVFCYVPLCWQAFGDYFGWSCREEAAAAYTRVMFRVTTT
jgi:hypothetical protein